MTSQETPDGTNSGKKDPRGLVLLMSIAIACVLAFGIWLLAGREQAPPVAEPAPNPGLLLGAFYMPGEFEPQDLLLLGGEQLAARHPGVMAAIARAAAGEVRVAILTNAGGGRAAIDSVLTAGGLGSLPLLTLPLPEMSMWVRDFGPLTVTDTLGRRSMVEFSSGERRGTRFDDGVPEHLAVQMDLAILGNRLKVEGGDLVTNGRGLGVLSTRVMDINTAGPETDPREIVQTVASMLGFEQVLLVTPLQGESSGHADMFCTFLAADLVVVGSIDPAVDAENAARLDRVAADLGGLSTFEGPMRVERLPLPDHADGVWRSYTPVVFANGVVLVPVFPDHCPDLDVRALEFYRRLLPDRRIVAVDASRLVRAGGSLRCVTLNVPVGGPLTVGQE